MKLLMAVICGLVGVILLPFILLFIAGVLSYGAAILISILSAILVVVVGILPLLIVGGVIVGLIVVAAKMTEMF